MNDYIVSARKYRPDSFDTLLGQDNIARTLKNSISRGQLAHAYLFCGPRGVGKTTTARIFAKMINCSNPLPGGDPCGECESCKSFAEGRSYCIFEMDAASNNSVDDIKELIDKVRVAPQVGRYSVYIIDEVHMLSQAAFNAFLKTLEEPPEYAIFILATTEKHKILPTILSRCQTYDFNRISVDNIVRNLREIAQKEGISIDDESLHVIAMKADGAMRDALTIFDQSVAFCGTDIHYADVIRNLNVLDYEYSFSLVKNFLAGDYASALRSFDEVLSKGFNALHFISAVSAHFRDLLVAKAGGIDSLLELADSLKQRYREQAAQCSEKFLYDALNLTAACEQGYKMAVNPRLHIEVCLMRLSFLNRAASTAAPVATAAAPAPQPAPQAVHQPAPAQSVVAQPVAPQPAPAQSVVVQPVAPQPAPAAPAAAPAPVQPQIQPAPAQVQPSDGPSKDTPATPAPVRRRPAAATVNGMSISSISADNNAPQQAGTPVSDAPAPEDDSIMEKWRELCELCRSKPRIFNALDSAKLSIEAVEGRKIVTYSVVNEALKEWMADKNARMEEKLRELLGSPKVNLVVDVQPEDPSERMAVSAEEKTREMMEKNPMVKDIISGLGLEIK